MMTNCHNLPLLMLPGSFLALSLPVARRILAQDISIPIGSPGDLASIKMWVPSLT